MGYTLSAEEIAAFADDGLVTPQYRLSDRLYQQAKAAVDEMIDELVGGRHRSSPSSPICRRGPVSPAARPAATRCSGSPSTPRSSTWWKPFSAPTSSCGAAACSPSRPAWARRVQWHQDSNWWPMKPMVTSTVWIAIDEASVDNGCLRYIPGSHLWPVLPHEDQTDEGLLGDCIRRSALDGAAAADIVLPPGYFSMHQANLVHGSEPNVSSKRRAGLVLRYMPATALFDRSDAEEIEQGSLMKTGDTAKYGVRPIWLVRGENRHPGNDFVVGHEPLADLDDLVAAARRGPAEREASRV